MSLAAATAPARPSAARGLVVSDLHLFAWRSEAFRRMESLLPVLRECDLLVLNGDLFDFRWSTHSDHAATLRHALQWLNDWMDRLPRCQFRYVLGNHDCLASFPEALERLASSRPQFQWREHTLQLGSHLFLHGDCANGYMRLERLQKCRRQWSQDRRRGLLARSLYQMSDWMLLTRAAHRVCFPHEATVRRITYHLDAACPGWRRRVQHCYFGHTHRPFSGLQREGIFFHNTGSAVAGMRFNPVHFDLDQEEAG